MHVTPVIVVGGGHQPLGVTVVPAKKLVSWLRRQPRLLSPDIVDKLHAVARRSTTWQP